MMSDWSTLKPNEWASMLFGFTAFCISLATLLRSFNADRKAEESKRKQEHRTLMLEIEEKRNTILDQLLAAELGLTVTKRQHRELLNEAHREGAGYVAARTEEAVASIDVQIALIAAMRAEASRDIDVSDGSDSGLSMLAEFDQVLIRLKPYANIHFLEEQGRAFIDPSREQLYLIRELKGALQASADKLAIQDVRIQQQRALVAETKRHGGDVNEASAELTSLEQERSNLADVRSRIEQTLAEAKTRIA